MARKQLLILFFLMLGLKVSAQQNYLPFNQFQYHNFEDSLYAIGSDFHTSVKPYREAQVREYTNPDSLDRFGYANGKFANTWFGSRILKQHAVWLDSGKFQLFLDPAFNLEAGQDRATDSSAYINTRGVQVGGNIGKKFSFYSAFYENQAKYAPYIGNYVVTHDVVPGQGRVKEFKGSANEFDFSNAEGYISYAPSTHFAFQFGHGKNFIGDGYRSLLLSDYGFNYPFFKVTANFWKIQYTSIWSSFLDVRNRPVVYERGFPKKYGHFNYLSYNVHKRVNIGLFEGVIWRDRYPSGNSALNLGYANPIIFGHSIFSGLDRMNNAVIGANAKIKVLKTTSVYGQFVVDDINLKAGGKGFIENRTGYQVGFKSYNLFTLPNLFVQGEYNTVRPYTYSHADPIQNYGHFNEPLAHPYGANFKEMVGILAYRFKDISLQIKTVYATIGRDTAGMNFGQNVFLTDTEVANGLASFDNTTGQGQEVKLMVNDVRLGYLINPASNLNIFLGYTGRSEKVADVENKTSYVYLGFRTDLRNFYYDF